MLNFFITVIVLCLYISLALATVQPEAFIPDRFAGLIERNRAEPENDLWEYETITTADNLLCYGTFVQINIVATTCSCAVNMGAVAGQLIKLDGSGSAKSPLYFKYVINAETQTEEGNVKFWKTVRVNIFSVGAHRKCEYNGRYWKFNIAALRTDHVDNNPLKTPTDKDFYANSDGLYLYIYQFYKEAGKLTFAKREVKPPHPNTCEDIVRHNADTPLESNAHCILNAGCKYYPGSPAVYIKDDDFIIYGIISSSGCCEISSVLVTHIDLINDIDVPNLPKSSNTQIMPAYYSVIFTISGILLK